MGSIGVDFEFKYWIRKYEQDYPSDTEGKYPIFIDENGVKHKERSPYFETISKVVQKRGYLLWREFVSIGEWKTERQKRRYRNNSKDDVENTTREAFEATDKDRIKILCKLKGVGIPVASAILTVVYPKEYCIIDYRTWRALLWLHAQARKKSFYMTSYEEYSDFLDRYDQYGTITAYMEFLRALKNIGERRNMTARQVEMALWKFDKMKGKKPKE